MSKSKIPTQNQQREWNEKVYADGLRSLQAHGAQFALDMAVANYEGMMDSRDPKKDLGQQWAFQTLKNDLAAIVRAEGAYKKGYAEVRLQQIMATNAMRKKVTTYWPELDPE